MASRKTPSHLVGQAGSCGVGRLTSRLVCPSPRGEQPRGWRSTAAGAMPGRAESPLPQLLQDASGMPEHLAQQPHAAISQVVLAQVQVLQAPAGTEHGAEVLAAGAGELALPQAAGEAFGERRGLDISCTVLHSQKACLCCLPTCPRSSACLEIASREDLLQSLAPGFL